MKADVMVVINNLFLKILEHIINNFIMKKITVLFFSLALTSALTAQQTAGAGYV